LGFVSSCSNGLPNYFAATVLATNPGGSKAEKLFDSVPDLMRTNCPLLFEIARLLLRLNHVASFIVNANHRIM
jgi:hypothetical protein